MVTRSRGARIRTLAATAALALVVCTTAAAAGSLRATLDQETVHDGETVRLTLELPDDGAPGGFDLSPLGADFEVLGSQQSQSIRIVNGDVERTRTLELTLRPRRAGTLTIPALEAGGATSAPLELTVLDASAAAARPHAARAGDPPDLFVEATVDEAKPFVQGEVRYTVRVHDGLGIREGALTHPEAGDLRVEPRGEARRYEKVLDGRRYVVHERQYALFPQASGEVTIPPVVLQARVADERRGRGGFDDPLFGDAIFDEMFARMRAGGLGLGSSLIDRMMSPGREVRVRSNPVSLSVKSRPEGASDGWFLPAREVELEQRWEPARPTFRVGETVRRTVVLRARGASLAQLPQLPVPAADGVRQYASGSDERAAVDGSVVERVHTVELLPTRAGSFTLPAIQVAWWDTAADEARTATLPAQTIEVAGAPGTSTTSAQQTAPAVARPAEAAAVAEPGAASERSVATPADGVVPRGPADWLRGPAAWVVGAFAVAALAACALLWRLSRSGAPVWRLSRSGAPVWRLSRSGAPVWRVFRRGARRPTDGAVAPGAATRPADAAPSSPRRLADALHRACTANDARATRDALLAWGRATWPASPPASAGDIGRRLGHRGFAQAVKQLDDVLYAPRAAAWDGPRLWSEFRGARKATSADADVADEPLPALYPPPRMA